MRARDRGVALLATLGVLSVLLVLASSYSLAVRTETRLTASAVHRTQASWLAEAGLQRAFVELRDHPEQFAVLSESNETSQPLVLTIDSAEESGLSLSEGRFVVNAIDEAARVNVNTASDQILEKLLADDPGLVDAIMDWRDGDAASRESGAEREFYESLPDPYESRDDWFQTLPEMLLLRDVTPARFFGEAGVSPLADEAEAGTADTELTPLSELFTVDSYDQNLNAAGEQRVDLTEADSEELSERLGDVLAPEEVEAIIEYRDGGTAQGPATDDGPVAVVGPPAAAEETPGDAGGEESETSRWLPTVAHLLDVLDRDKVQRIYDQLTTSADSTLLGLVNVNTASAEVLASLPGMDATIADALVQARREQPFETVGDLLRLTEISNEVFKQVAPLLTTRSLAYRLTASGTVG
ncbi:MAG: general secretion pathway protein GspK, partial [Armatimonadetes bacterium]|nr:general secretion pathway protein GspK [Armatimonadota bacterium]